MVGKGSEIKTKVSPEKKSTLRERWESVKQSAIKVGAIASLALVLASCSGPKTNKELRADFKEVKTELKLKRQELAKMKADYEALKKNDVFFNDEAKKVNTLLGGALSPEQRGDLEQQLENILDKLEEISEESNDNEEERRAIMEKIHKLESDSISLESQLGSISKGRTSTGVIPPKRTFQ